MKKPEKNKKYVCSICNKELKNKQALTLHTNIKHLNKKSKLNYKKCYICNKLITFNQYEKHLNSCKRKQTIYYCEKCGKLVTKKFGSGRFCSRSCANSRVHSEECKARISKSIKNNPGGWNSIEKRKERNFNFENNKKEYYKNPNKCVVCNKILNYKQKNNKTCSKQCLKKYLKGKLGGYRINSGKGKNGRYKGIYCASTYELVYLIYCLDHNLNIKRANFKLEFNKEIYYPDFILDNNIVEIKGYYSKNLDKQIRVAKGNNFNIIVKFKEDLEKEFNWVKNNYKYKKITDLYD